MHQSHRVVPRDGQAVTIHGVWASDRSFDDGPEGRPGQQCTLVVTIRARREHLDGDVARVGFQGLDNGFPHGFDVPVGTEYRSGLWDLLFPIRRSVPDPDAAAATPAADAGGADAPDGSLVEHRYVGSFFVETIHGTYYWLKHEGASDFTFGYDALPTLRTWGAELT